MPSSFLQFWLFRAVLKPIPGLGASSPAGLGWARAGLRTARRGTQPWIQSPSRSSVATHRRRIILYSFKMSHKSIVIPMMSSLSSAHFDVPVARSPCTTVKPLWRARVHSSRRLVPRSSCFIHLPGGCKRLRPLLKNMLL